MTPTIRPTTEGRTIAVVGDVYPFLFTGDDTNGKFALWEAIVPPGGGWPAWRRQLAKRNGPRLPKLRDAGVEVLHRATRS